MKSIHITVAVIIAQLALAAGCSSKKSASSRGLSETEAVTEGVAKVDEKVDSFDIKFSVRCEPGFLAAGFTEAGVGVFRIASSSLSDIRTFVGTAAITKDDKGNLVYKLKELGTGKVFQLTRSINLDAKGEETGQSFEFKAESGDGSISLNDCTGFPQ